MGPAGLPKYVIDKIYVAAQKTVLDPAVRKRIEDTAITSLKP